MPSRFNRRWRRLAGIGVDVEPLRWWDEHQTGDVIHHFGRMSADLVRLAQAKNTKVVMAELLTAPHDCA